MLPVYLTKSLAIVNGYKDIVLPHYSNIDVLKENLNGIFPTEEFELINVDFDKNSKELTKYSIKDDEIFIGEEIFSEENIKKNEGLFLTEESYDILLANYNIVGPNIFLTVKDDKLLYELGYSYFTQLFKNKEIKDALLLRGLANILYSKTGLVSLVTDTYYAEGFMSLMLPDIKNKEINLANVFFSSFDVELFIDFGLDEEHKIVIKKGKREKIDIGEDSLDIRVKADSKEYKIKVNASELGFFVDTRKKPIKSINLGMGLLWKFKQKK